MAASQPSEVIQHLRSAVLLRDGAGLTDGQLLEDYISRREEAAFAALVRRHGPMVWGVCRRALHNHHDAEDAFQATFLVLVRKAASIVPRQMVANWLYGVAHQTALKARATAARRRARERQVTDMPEPEVAEQNLWHDLQPLLDQELSRLPDKYRVAIVLCDLEGKTYKEAARQLACPEGTLSARLARARTMLARRLAQWGVVLSAGALAAVLSQRVASAGVPTSVVSSTIKAATTLAAGKAVAAGVISAKVAALTEGVLKTMLLTKLKIATAVLLVVAALSGAAVLIYRTQAADKPPSTPSADQKPGGPPKTKDGAPKEDAAKKDREKFQGSWKVVSVKINGRDDETDNSKLIFAADKVTLEKRGKTEAEWRYKLNPNRKPKEIDLIERGRTQPGIYELDGDKLKIAYAERGEERPKEFATKGVANSYILLLILQRADERKGEKGK